MSTNSERLATIQADLNNLLEQRIGDLLGVVRAAQELTRQIIATEEEIRRQERIRERLQAELGPLKADAEGRRTEVDDLKKLLHERMGNLSGLKGEIGDE